MKRLLAMVLFPLAASAADLETKNYLVHIESACAEGDVSCNQMTYTGKSKISGNAITLSGGSWHTTCADGVTPCRFLGYRFANGNVTYYVHQDGLLEVIRNQDEVLVREQGQWQPDQFLSNTDSQGER